MNTETKQATAIEMIPCKSSQIAAIGHDSETNTLAIQFPSKTGAGTAKVVCPQQHLCNADGIIHVVSVSNRSRASSTQMHKIQTLL